MQIREDTVQEVPDVGARGQTLWKSADDELYGRTGKGNQVKIRQGGPGETEVPQM